MGIQFLWVQKSVIFCYWPRNHSDRILFFQRAFKRCPCLFDESFCANAIPLFFNKAIYAVSEFSLSRFCWYEFIKNLTGHLCIFWRADNFFICCAYHLF